MTMAKLLWPGCCREAGKSVVPAMLRLRTVAKSVEANHSSYLGIACRLLASAVPCGAAWRLRLRICSGIAAAVAAAYLGSVGGRG